MRNALLITIAFGVFHNCDSIRTAPAITSNVIVKSVKKELDINPISIITSSVGRFKNGIVNLIPDVKKAYEIRQRKLSKGLSHISFTEYQTLDKTW